VNQCVSSVSRDTNTARSCQWRSNKASGRSVWRNTTSSALPIGMSGRPYLSKFALQSVIDTLNEALAALDLAEAENEIADVKAALLLAKETIQKKIDSLQEV
jgi:hypothetical protein